MLMLKGKYFNRLENLTLQTWTAMSSFTQQNRNASSLAYISGMQLCLNAYKNHSKDAGRETVQGELPLLLPLAAGYP